MDAEQRKQWVSTYFTPEQQAKMRELGAVAYAAEARATLQARGDWTEADQQRASQQWDEVGREHRRLVAAGADPARAAGSG